MEVKIDDILKRNQLSVTNGRRKILEFFLHHEGALSHSDIEKRAGGKFDRVTVYRTLQAFLEKGLIHSIPTADNAVRYALCRDNCSAGQHRDDHVHFVCQVCGNITCLDDTTIPAIRLPEGFACREIEIVVSGVCKTCNG